MVRAGSRTSSPRVAIRAYPANAKNNRPAACSTPPTAAPAPTSSRAASAAPEARRSNNDGSQDGEYHGHDRARQPGRLLYAGIVHRGQRHHGRDGHRVRLRRPDVRADRQRHRRTGGGLADHERPARQIPPEVTQPLAAVDVGAARRGVPGGEPGRRHRVAVGDHRGHRQTRAAALSRRRAPPEPGRRRSRRRSSTRGRSPRRRKAQAVAAARPEHRSRSADCSWLHPGVHAHQHYDLRYRQAIPRRLRHVHDPRQLGRRYRN